MARPHKPTAVKTAAGNPGKRALNKQEPDPEYLRDLAAPADLPDGAKAIWREVVPMLARNRLATQADIRILRKLCIAEWQYDMAVERLKAFGLISEIVSWKLRLFVPTGAEGASVLGRLLERYPLQRVVERHAAQAA